MTIPAADMALLTKLTSAPLVRVTSPRFNGAREASIKHGHAVRDVFIPSGDDLDVAKEAAFLLTRKSRDLYAPNVKEVLNRPTAIIHGESGRLYLAPLSSDPWDPERAGRAALEVVWREGRAFDGTATQDIVRRVGDEKVMRPSPMSNQVRAASMSLEPPYDPYLGQPVVEAVHPSVVGITTRDHYAPLDHGPWAAPGEWATPESWAAFVAKHPEWA